MKKMFFRMGLISMVLITGFSFMGCASTSSDWGTYDPSVPEDQLCTLEIAGGLKVTGFNGTSVSWAQNGSVDGEGIGSKSWEAQAKGSEYKTIIRIPAGDHTLQANIYLWDYNEYPGYVHGSGYIYADGLEISHSFQPGHTYFLRPVLVIKSVFAKEESETINYNNSGPTLAMEGVYLRIDENGSPVASGNRINRR